MVVQFLTGCFVDPDYLDSYSRIALRNLTSLRGFWFDCVTSMPWSYMDYYAYQVRGASGVGERPRACEKGGWGLGGGGHSTVIAAYQARDARREGLRNRAGKSQG